MLTTGTVRWHIRASLSYDTLAGIATPARPPDVVIMPVRHVLSASFPYTCMGGTILPAEHRYRSSPRFTRLSPQPPVDPAASASSSELRAHIERVLSAHYELDS